MISTAGGKCMAKETRDAKKGAEDAAKQVKARWRCRRCGLRVIPWREGWKHAVAGQHGRTPAHRRHTPEPMSENDYDALFELPANTGDAIQRVVGGGKETP